jgi:hypothetical protein
LQGVVELIPKIAADTPIEGVVNRKIAHGALLLVEILLLERLLLMKILLLE